MLSIKITFYVNILDNMQDIFRINQIKHRDSPAIENFIQSQFLIQFRFEKC